ncbi:uncharacterized protein SPPG_06580 [Spizellomyces punctatus DAOM BR117]|uniref:CobW/HypB/UreG nucleotide-binding domain-containing protein n=1 Tax=Spizellomyces punctatus (strain DAOM BR117) TaxID=645134 RepID=A0A0L0HB70_SPIPD|nr:uncharacterized protein SPPG_06580 [Spizellomyces punctatus DAOM BR117]KNC98176.1 hypothetical protein SPPG_06580 [Spizellomyces punctatus DAOM BR117]|eukprot:XP_016606216.1 hypothetical protein SPPG_06580 [Spizellomyces punctatus DAOM BR117]
MDIVDDDNKAQTTPRIPITVFTGFLGAGKTTLILSLIQRLPKGYNVVLLKNEFGDVKVDSELARESNVKVTEMLNGCMCCVLVGQMKNALEEIRDTMSPSRIIIETSGSAFPAPIAWQIRSLPSFSLDAIITVIDCLNFKGYEDTSYTAKLQAQYTDLLLLNKYELASERQLEDVLDRVNDLNTDTPKVPALNGSVNPDLVFGIDTSLFGLDTKEADTKTWAGLVDPHHMDNEVDVVCLESSTFDYTLNRVELDKLLGSIPSDVIYRIKGLILLSDPDGLFILNWAFGRYELTPVTREIVGVRVKVTVMGVDMQRWVETLRVGLGIGV